MTAYAVNDNGTYTALRAANDKSVYTLSFTGSRLGVFALTDLLDGELPFRDVNTGDWYYDDVRYVYENGLMNGVTTTQFAPKTDITRGMLVTILYRVEGEPVAPRLIRSRMWPPAATMKRPSPGPRPAAS